MSMYQEGVITQYGVLTLGVLSQQALHTNHCTLAEHINSALDTIKS